MCIEALRTRHYETPDGDRSSRTGLVTSSDGTVIAFEQRGQGPALVLVEGVLIHRAIDPRGAKLAASLARAFTVYRYDRRGRGASGDLPPYAVDREVDDLQAIVAAAGGHASVYGRSSGAVLALDAARRLTGIDRLALYEPPFIVDDSRPNLPSDYLCELNELTAAGRRSEAVRLFLTAVVGLSDNAVATVRAEPVWQELEAVAHTLNYDYTIMAGTQTGTPLPEGRWSSVQVPTLILTTAESERHIETGAAALADMLPHARHKTLRAVDDHAAQLRMLASEIESFCVRR